MDMLLNYQSLIHKYDKFGRKPGKVESVFEDDPFLPQQNSHEVQMGQLFGKSDSWNQYRGSADGGKWDESKYQSNKPAPEEPAKPPADEAVVTPTPPVAAVDTPTLADTAPPEQNFFRAQPQQIGSTFQSSAAEAYPKMDMGPTPDEKKYLPAEKMPPDLPTTDDPNILDIDHFYKKHQVEEAREQHNAYDPFSGKAKWNPFMRKDERYAKKAMLRSEYLTRRQAAQEDYSAYLAQRGGGTAGKRMFTTRQVQDPQNPNQMVELKIFVDGSQEVIGTVPANTKTSGGSEESRLKQNELFVDKPTGVGGEIIDGRFREVAHVGSIGQGPPTENGQHMWNPFFPATPNTQDTYLKTSPNGFVGVNKATNNVTKLGLTPYDEPENPKADPIVKQIADAREKVMRLESALESDPRDRDIEKKLNAAQNYLARLEEIAQGSAPPTQNAAPKGGKGERRVVRPAPGVEIAATVRPKEEPNGKGKR